MRVHTEQFETFASQCVFLHLVYSIEGEGDLRGVGRAGLGASAGCAGSIGSAGGGEGEKFSQTPHCL